MELDISKHIINWYGEYKRNLPWRKTKDPYKIWLSEIILQQTQVKQGLPYYQKFVSYYPTVYQLAGAEEDEIMKLWQGLGYYSRARNLHFTAKVIVNDNNGVFPNTYKDLLKLKGVGEYTAAAISSFAYGEPVAVLDGNVFRVLARYFGIDTPINSTEGKKIFKSKVNEVLNKKEPALHNQAIMEFGALLCKPKSPDCMFCSLNLTCVAYQQDKVKDLPVKLKTLKRRTRYFNYLLIQSTENEFLLKQRLHKDIWQKLFEFPLIESKGDFEKDDVLQTRLFDDINLSDDFVLEKINNKTYKHVLSHQDIYADFWLIKYSSKFLKHKLENYSVVNSKSIRSFAVPILIDRFLNEHFSEN